MNKKVVFLVSSLGGGGAERISAELCNYLYSKGVQSSILETEEHGTSYHVDPDVGVVTLGCKGTGRVEMVHRLLLLKRYLERSRPDVVVSLGYAFKYLDALRVHKSCSLVISERNYPLATYSDRDMRRRERLFFNAEKVVFQTPDAAACYGPSVRRKAAIIPNPIASISVKARSRANRVVTACRLVPQKNLGLLLEGFSRFHGTHSAYTLDVFGDGPMRGELMERADSLGLAQSVRFLPFSDTLHEDIADAAMFVSTSDFEGLQNSLMEAMAMGIPSIATDCLGGGARLISGGGERALLVPRGDADALAAAMSRVVDVQGLADSLSAKGEMLSELYSSDAICKMWYDYITSEGSCLS